MGRMLRIIKQSGPEYPGESEKSYIKEISYLWSCQFYLYKPICLHLRLFPKEEYILCEEFPPDPSDILSFKNVLPVLSLSFIKNYRINVFSAVS